MTATLMISTLSGALIIRTLRVMLILTYAIAPSPTLHVRVGGGKRLQFTPDRKMKNAYVQYKHESVAFRK